jgi:co-chaperonin GroES (HSP10)
LQSNVARRLIPLFDRVLVARAAAQTKTAGGILLPEPNKRVNEVSLALPARLQ